jgi:hypothetical protein
MASSANRKHLHDLVEDVLILILIECDAAGVLALSEVGSRPSSPACPAHGIAPDQ